MGAEQRLGAVAEPCSWGKSPVPVRCYAEPTAAADALQRRSHFRQQVSASVRPHGNFYFLGTPARWGEFPETRAR